MSLNGQIGGIFLEFRKESNLIGLDLRGHGSSTKPLDMKFYSPEVLARDINEVISFLELKDITLVVWSIGGLILMNYLKFFGEKSVKKLVFVAARTEGGSKGNQLIDFDREKYGGILSDDPIIYEKCHRNFMNDLAYKSYQKPSYKEICDFSKVPAKILRNVVLSLTEVSNEEFLKNIHVPSVIIHGREDRLISLKMSKYTSNLVKDSRLVIMDNVGHMPFAEKVEFFNSELFAGS